MYSMLSYTVSVTAVRPSIRLSDRPYVRACGSLQRSETFESEFLRPE
jgi:hypothetical protein